MCRFRVLGRVAIVPALGVVMATVFGCGNDSYPVDPEGGERLKQARINAYGKSGYDQGKQRGSQGPQDLSGQNAARQRAQGNR